MIELTKERIEQLLHEEVAKKEELNTILRGVFTRYMHMYERYFADIDALNDDTVASLRAYHEETKSLVKYYYMDIPLDTCKCLETYDNDCIAKLLGPDWQKNLSDACDDFKKHYTGELRSRDDLRAAFAKQSLGNFYDAMDLAFRDAFGTGSKTADSAVNELSGLLFGDEK